MSAQAMLSSAVAAAVLLLAACAQQPSPSLPIAAPIRPVAKRATQPQPSAAHASQIEGARANGVMPNRSIQRDCTYQGLLIEDHVQDEDPSALGLNSVLAGQSARDACLRAAERNAGRSGATP